MPPERRTITAEEWRRRPPLRLSPVSDAFRPRWVWLYCTASGCGHSAATATAPWIIRWGPDAWADGLREHARCSACGAKDITIRLPSWGGGDVGWLPFPVQDMAAT